MTNIQTIANAHKVSVANLDVEFSKLAEKLRSLENQKDLIHRCEIFFQAYLESDSPNAIEGAYLFFWVVKPLVELSFEDPNARPTYDKSNVNFSFEAGHVNFWTVFFHSYIASDFIGGKNKGDRKIDLKLYQFIYDFMVIASSSK